jgi:antitoxin (DNA-binding transcriptional repressor) of toxin-antitoxin stability system
MAMEAVTITFSEAKARLSLCGRRAQEGTTTTVLKHRRPAFVIAPVPVPHQHRPKKWGLAQGKIRMAPDFDPTPADVIAAFEGTP